MTRDSPHRLVFPATRLSIIVGARSADVDERATALEALASAYWKPIYKYIRVKWHKSHEDAADLTQGFFMAAIEKDFFRSYDAERAKFRTFVRTCVDGFVANEHKSATRLKRSGSVTHVPLDFAEAEAELTRSGINLANSADAMEEFFYQEWTRSLFTLSIEVLRQECEAKGRSVYFKLFERYDLDETIDREKLSYSSLANEFGLSTTRVTNYLAFARREFRRIVLDKLREITATGQEFRSEAKRLLGIDTE